MSTETIDDLINKIEANGTSEGQCESSPLNAHCYTHAGKKVLDVCCGPRMFWFDKEHEDALYVDIRDEEHTLCDDREIEIKPDVQADFRDLPLEDKSFQLVVFDPPHLQDLGKSSWTAKKYGRLFPSWEGDIAEGFKECFRVLKDDGILIFKWNEHEIPVSRILELTDREPLFGHKSGKQQNTHWMCFMK